MTVSLQDQAILTALPGYEIGEELGRGAWGVVRAGRHRQLGREVAIKQLPPEAAADPAVRARFVAEARMLAALNHPHIVPVYDYVERDGLCLLIMERLSGDTLWNRFAAGDLDLQGACAAILATCAGLHHAHQRGTLHRDVKPQNLMFSAEGVLKVSDFGMAKVMAGSVTLASREGQVLGTPAYMAPEQASGRRLGPGTDIYATGVVLYELLSGRLPFPRDSKPIATLYRHVHEMPTPISDLAPWVPEPIAAVAMTAIAKDPSDRYPTAEAFGVALAAAATRAWGPGWLAGARFAVSDSAMLAAASGEAQAAEAPTQTSSSEHPAVPSDGPDPVTAAARRLVNPRRKRRRPVVLALVALVALFGSAGAVLLAGQRTRDPQPPPSALEGVVTPPPAPAPAPPGAPSAIGWRPLRDAPVGRQAAAVAVTEGTVWVIGGQDTPTRVDRYDAAIDTWSAGPDLPVGLHHAAAVTYRGELVVVGGWTPVAGQPEGRTSGRVFALRNGVWVELPSLQQPRAAAAAAVVDDRIVVVGGQADRELVSRTEIYDGTEWLQGQSIPTPREHLAAASDGTYLYAVGGRDLWLTKNLGTLERYDPAADRWEQLTDMPTARGSLGAAVVSGQLVTAGGEGPVGTHATVEAYNLEDGRWSTLPGLGVARHGLALATVGSELFAIGGSAHHFHESPSAVVETLTVPPARPDIIGAWQILRPAFTARQQTAATVSGGMVWVIGGLEGQHATPRVEGYDPMTNQWHPGVDLPVPLHHATAVTYRGQVVVIGGWEPDGGDISGRTSDRVWALSDGRWTELPRLNRPRAAAAAVVVGDRIVVVGGQADGRLVAVTEIFDGQRWVDAPALPTPREHLAAATDGHFVYVAGGRELSSDRNVAALERFDPATGRWDVLPPMPTARGGLAATMVDGRLITAGGEHPTGVFGTVEAYDIATGAWSQLAPLSIPRHGLGLVALDGTLYAMNGATEPTHAVSSAALEALRT